LSSVPTYIPECFFLDVGQGSANVVLLPDNRALIIDVGPKNAWPVLKQLFVENRVNAIACAVLSHNDADHIGGWEQCALHFGLGIQKWLLLQDRKDIKKGKALDIVVNLAERGIIRDPIPAYVDNLTTPKSLWSDEAYGIELQLLYPSMIKAMRKAQQGKHNDCSAVVQLLAPNSSSILFTGDVSYSALQQFMKANKQQPLNVTIMTVPHHGSDANRNVTRLLPDVVRSKFAIISVGTSGYRSYGHPSPSTIKACRKQEAHVMCTQITEQCHDLSDLGAGNVIEVDDYSLSHPTMRHINRAAKSRGKGCAGTVTATISSTGIDVQSAGGHETAVSKLQGPMCTIPASELDSLVAKS